ncbi:hypothetical protein ACN263_08240 [Micromonospora sp. WMMD729]|uniref:hypothetical protein n=1 Tax=Micromonospora sp. WMMD729 TaxID=3404127 RepID=UPI003BF519A6
MSFWEFVTDIGVPLLLVGGAAVIAVGAFTDPPEEFSWPRGWDWAWVVGVWFMASGEAAFGTDRPWWERAWKGAAALLLVVACLVAVWRRWRWRRRARGADGGAAG